MFNFCLLSTPVSHGFKASKLLIDGIHVLADPTWNGRDTNDASFMEPHIRDSSFIILSHSTPEFIGGYALLCSKYSALMASIPVYSTVAVSQLGRVSSVEYYRSIGLLGPLLDATLEVNDIDEFFDRIVLIKFSQNVSVLDNRVTLSAFNAGHTLGGSFWSIKKRNEKIIYAPAWNQSRDSFLQGAQFFSSESGNPQSSLSRPTAFITGSNLGSPVPYKSRIERMLNLVDATLANGGAVLMPVNISGRFLEVFHIIDQHLSTLQGAAIPVYFLSYTGTKVLTYTSGLTDWLSSNLAKEFDGLGGERAFSNTSFDPSKVDQLLDPSELALFPGPKIVFASGINMHGGDLSFKALKLLCLDEKTTIILTEKSALTSPPSLASQLYASWFDLASNKQPVKLRDGVVVALEKDVPASMLIDEISLKGSELVAYQAAVTQRRHEQAIESIKNLRARKILQSELQSDESDDEENESEEIDENKDGRELVRSMNGGGKPRDLANEEDMPDKSTNDEKSDNAGGNHALESSLSTTKDALTSGNSQVQYPTLHSNETFITELINEKLKSKKTVDIQLTNKLRPRQAMFPTMSVKRRKIDDYGENLDSKHFRREDEQNINSRIISDSKKRFQDSSKRPWAGEDKKLDRSQYQDKERISLEAKLTPQQVLNNEILRKYLDTTFSPVRRSMGHRRTSITVRCGLTFVDFSGYVDLRSMNLVVSSLRPGHLIILPDETFQTSSGSESNGAITVASSHMKMNISQNAIESQTLKNSFNKFTTFFSRKSQQTGTAPEMLVTIAKYNSPIELNKDGLSHDGEFETLVDESLWSALKWSKIDTKHRIAPIVGALDIFLKDIENLNSSLSDSASQIVLRKFERSDACGNDTYDSTTGNPDRFLSIGRVRMPELKRKLQDLGFDVEFKGEGTLVIDDDLAVRKTDAYQNGLNDLGDIIIDGHVGPVYYKVRKCIQEMLAFVK